MNTSASEILATLAQLGVSIRANGDHLWLEPASRIPPELVFLIVEVKPQILEALARPTPAQPAEPARCAHCEGAGECNCPACTLRRTTEPTPCSMCRWEDHRLWLAATRPRECWHCEERRLHGEAGLCSNCEAKPGVVQ
jgi:hypothetical protein